MKGRNKKGYSDSGNSEPELTKNSVFRFIEGIDKAGTKVLSLVPCQALASPIIRSRRGGFSQRIKQLVFTVFRKEPFFIELAFNPVGVDTSQ